MNDNYFVKGILKLYLKIQYTYSALTDNGKYNPFLNWKALTKLLKF